MPEKLPRPVLLLSLSRMSEAVGNGFVVLALPTSVAVLPHDLIPAGEPTRVGLLISLFGFVLAATQPVVGRFARSQRRQLAFMFGGISVFALSTAAMSLGTQYWHLLALRVTQGVCMAFVVPSTLALVSHFAAPGHRGAAMGFYGMARMVGFGIGPILGGAVLLSLHDHRAYLIAAVPGVIAGALVWFGVPRGSAAEPPLADTIATGPGTGGAADANGGAGPERGTEPSSPASTRTSSRASTRRSIEAKSGPAPAAPVDPGLRPFVPLAIGLFACACSLSIMAVLENQFMARLDQRPFDFGIAFSAAVLVRVFADLPLGRLSDRIGRKVLIVPGLFALAPLTVLMAYAPSTASLTVVRLLMGVAMGCVSPTIFALASDLAPPPFTAQRMAWVTSGFALGLAVGPLLTGVVADAAGFEGPFWLFGAICLVAGAYVAATAAEAPPLKAFR